MLQEKCPFICKEYAPRYFPTTRMFKYGMFCESNRSILIAKVYNLKSTEKYKI